MSRTVFNDFKKMDTRGLTDLLRAARFYFLLRASFACQLDGSFRYSRERKSRLKLGEELRAHLKSIHERLQKVTIENANYDYIIKRLDAPETLFYIDPPYWGCENVYGKLIWSKEDFYTLKEQLDGIKGKFIVSLNNTPEVRELFKDYKFQHKKIRWSVNNNAAHEDHNGNELIITNF